MLDIFIQFNYVFLVSARSDEQYQRRQHPNPHCPGSTAARWSAAAESTWSAGKRYVFLFYIIRLEPIIEERYGKASNINDHSFYRWIFSSFSSPLGIGKDGSRWQRKRRRLRKRHYRVHRWSWFAAAAASAGWPTR